MVFKNLCVLVLWMKVASALEGLDTNLCFIPKLVSRFNYYPQTVLIPQVKSKHEKVKSQRNERFPFCRQQIDLMDQKKMSSYNHPLPGYFKHIQKNPCK